MTSRELEIAQMLYDERRIDGLIKTLERHVGSVVDLTHELSDLNRKIEGFSRIVIEEEKKTRQEIIAIRNILQNLLLMDTK